MRCPTASQLRRIHRREADAGDRAAANPAAGAHRPGAGARPVPSEQAAIFMATGATGAWRLAPPCWFPSLRRRCCWTPGRPDSPATMPETNGREQTAKYGTKPVAVAEDLQVHSRCQGIVHAAARQRTGQNAGCNSRTCRCFLLKGKRWPKGINAALGTKYPRSGVPRNPRRRMDRWYDVTPGMGAGSSGKPTLSGISNYRIPQREERNHD